ncbi:predicted protein [Histoplasma capsulatum G186AR]|uniref:F-box domain-containing protein n=1 Tax=Ajellomyces capsulatus (strain G186AR / H82 / ATCC MYA-2454 / RMSCC 2432) TaxID=447093 RepID=C0NGK3_AJECG|nr:uncharacterized protein HCBG_02475 [Histoplasma capsulatum G186AR]EEH08938.1 predicted protein [Histoplasma capsulatum G186AR]
MKTTITRLSIELKQQIADHLNMKDIAYLAYICKFFLLIELYLYKTINLNTSKKTYFHVLKLSAMINKDSTLAEYIKTLKISDLRKDDIRQMNKLNELMKAEE